MHYEMAGLVAPLSTAQVTTLFSDIMSVTCQLQNYEVLPRYLLCLPADFRTRTPVPHLPWHLTQRHQKNTSQMLRCFQGISQSNSSLQRAVTTSHKVVLLLALLLLFLLLLLLLLWHLTQPLVQCNPPQPGLEPPTGYDLLRLPRKMTRFQDLHSALLCFAQCYEVQPIKERLSADTKHRLVTKFKKCKFDKAKTTPIWPHVQPCYSTHRDDSTTRPKDCFNLPSFVQCSFEHLAITQKNASASIFSLVSTKFSGSTSAFIPALQLCRTENFLQPKHPTVSDSTSANCKALCCTCHNFAASIEILQTSLWHVAVSLCFSTHGPARFRGGSAESNELPQMSF